MAIEATRGPGGAAADTTPPPTGTTSNGVAVARPRGLGFWALTSLVIGNVIGSSIFVLPATLAPFGGLAIVSWLITSAGALLLALAFARLAAAVPKAGGPYVYTRVAFGDFAGFLIAWGYWIGLWASVAAVAVGTLSYVGALIPPVANNLALSGVIAIGMVWVLTFVNLRGVSGAGRLQTITTVLKLVPLVAIGTIGLASVNWSYFAPTVPPGYPSTFSAIIGATTLTLFSYLGIESATVPADDVEEPARTIPRATVVGTLIVAAVYIFSTIGVLGALPPSALAGSPAPYAAAAAAIWGPWAAIFVTLGAIISGFGALNGFILLQGQVPMAVARDRLFPERFARMSPAGVPAFGCVVSSILATAVLLTNYSGRGGASGLVDVYSSIILLATFTTLVPYAFCAAAELLLAVPRRGEPDASGRRLWVTMSIGLLAFVFSFFCIIGAGPDTALKGFAGLLLGIPVFVWLQRRHFGGGEGVEQAVAAVES
jgi:APA family basic amino acid/polyamine antiporter